MESSFLQGLAVGAYVGIILTIICQEVLKKIHRDL